MMSEFLRQKKPAPMSGPDDGFNAMGKPIPNHRQENAYRHCKEMGMKKTEDIWTCINTVAAKLERDQPYEAMTAGMVYLDLIGTYRLFAVLLTG